MEQLAHMLIQVLFVVAIAPLSLGVVKKCKAFFQNRVGASPFLPYQRIATLWGKETLVSRTASFVYHVVPVSVFAIAVILSAYVPLLRFGVSTLSLGFYFAVAGLFMLGSVLLVLAGLDTGGAFGGMASSREMTIASLVEPAVLLAFSGFAIHSIQGSDSISMLSSDIFHSPALLLSVLALMFVALAENARFPVDNPATHLELTMVHEGMILEYSGRQLALLEYASAVKLTIFALLIANIIFPLYALPLYLLLLASVVKLVAIMFFLALLESTIAKMRFYRMQEYLATAAFLGLSAIVLAVM